MAGRPPVNKTEEAIEVAQTPQVDNTAILEMLAQMQQQLTSLKEENETLRNQKNAPIQNTQDDFNQLVTIRNMYTGIALSLKLDESGRVTTLEGFGTTMRKRLVEVLDICRLNKKFAELGYFVIEDSNIVEKYFPEMIPLYEKTLKTETLKDIGLLTEKDLIEAYTNSNYVYQRAIVDRFISEWAKGEDENYLSHSKIQALTKVSGVDIMSLINSVMERENIKKEFSK